MANRRAAASNSADGMNLIDGPANQRKALALNEEQLAANHCNELFASQVGATGFEPPTSRTQDLGIAPPLPRSGTPVPKGSSQRWPPFAPLGTAELSRVF